VREAVFTLPPRRTVPVKKIYLIVNPFGGKGRGKIVLKAALGTLALHVKVHQRFRKEAVCTLTLSFGAEIAMQTKQLRIILSSITCDQSSIIFTKGFV
jgi:hypothetical protein